MEVKHGDFLSAWTARVAARLAAAAMDEFLDEKKPARSLASRMQRRFDALLIEEGQALIRAREKPAPKVNVCPACHGTGRTSPFSDAPECPLCRGGPNLLLLPEAKTPSD